MIWKKYSLALALLGLLACLWPPVAHADDDLNLNVNSAVVTSLRTTLKGRHAQLRPYLENGTVGIAASGLLVVRDQSQVPVAERQKLLKLLAADAEDWNALYEEIARANGHPEWETQIRQIFHKRMQERAASHGWWIQDTAGWVKK